MAGSPHAVITGLGVVCAAGSGVARLWTRLLDGAALPTADSSDGRAHGPARVRGSEPAFAMAAEAIAEAIEHAEHPGRRQGGSAGRAGLIVGTTLGSTDVSPAADAARAGARSSRREPLRALASRLARRFGLTTHCTTLSCACASSTAAIGLGAELIRSGELDYVVAGGVDPHRSMALAGFSALGLLAGATAGGSRGERGTRLAAGAAFAVLESAERAAARGADAIAGVSGHATTFDALHPTSPDAEGRGMRRAMTLALAQAVLGIDDVDAVSLHGIGTRAVDAMEMRALHEVFAARTRPLPVLGFTPATGYALGAIGAVHTVACALALCRGLIPPGSVTHLSPAPLATSFPSPDQTSTRLRSILKLSWGFGGVNSVLLLTRSAPALSLAADPS